MDDLYSIHPGIARTTIFTAGEVAAGCGGEIWIDDGFAAAPGSGRMASDFTDIIKARISSHPRYPSLLSAYIECRKVGAPPDMAMVFEEIARERSGDDDGEVAEIGADPELDEFMVSVPLENTLFRQKIFSMMTSFVFFVGSLFLQLFFGFSSLGWGFVVQDSYCRLLVRYKDELSKPLDEAVSFLASVESQLRSLCKESTAASSSSSGASATAGAGAVTSPLLSYEALGSSDEEPSYRNDDASESYNDSSSLPDNELKEMLLKKYSGYLSSLKKEFLKKRKKGKIPRDARSTLLDWWNSHYQWPYPTEEEKVKLTKLTGLDQKQVNNWFINQRKRYWKPSEDMQLALVDGLWGGSSVATLCFERGTIGP